MNVIDAQAAEKAPNCLIGKRPHETIEACRRTLWWLATMGNAESSGIVIADTAVLRNICGALEHARWDSTALWNSAMRISDESEDFA